MKSLVSIITPCYNAETTIAKTIESVLSQTYESWEMLVIDDCSNDNSEAIIKNFAGNDNRIKYLKTDKPSGSPSIPRNIGIDLAKGKYIAFLDADDIWLPDKLTEQLFFAELKNATFIYSDYEKITYDGVRSNRTIKMRATSTYWDTLQSCSIPCLTVLLKKDIIGTVRFKSIVKEDYAFWLEILKTGTIAYNTKKVHALYRESKYSRSSNKFSMFKNQWLIIHGIERINILFAIYCMIIFSIKGFLKYLK